MGNITKKEVEKMQKRSQARKKRLEGRREHIRQTIESLLINDGFINDTKEIRNKWGIPKDGFCPNQVALDWQDKLRAKNPDFKFTEDFLAFHKQSIKTKLNLLGVNCESIVEQIMNLYIETGKLTPSKQYYYEVHKIKIKFGLDDRWMPFLTSLIEFGSTNSHLSIIAKGYELMAKKELDVNERQILLRLYPDIHGKEIEYAWKYQIKNQVQGFLKPKNKRKKISKSDHLDGQLFLLHKDGLSNKEIAEEYQMFLERPSITPDKLEALTADDIRIHKYKKRHNIN